MTGGFLTHGALPPLICLHAAGATSAMFSGMRQKLKAQVKLTGIDLPGRGSAYDKPLLHSMGEAVDHVHPHVAGLTDRGYGIFGYSMGALVGFALTRRLIARGGPLPAVLIIAAARAPHLPPRETDLHKMADPALLEELSDFDGTSHELLADAELMALVLPRLRADFELCETFDVDISQKVPVPIHAFGGQEDEKITLADLAAWMDLSTKQGSFQTLPGGHFFMDRQADQLATRICAILHASFDAKMARNGSHRHG